MKYSFVIQSINMKKGYKDNFDNGFWIETLHRDKWQSS